MGNPKNDSFGGLVGKKTNYYENVNTFSQIKDIRGGGQWNEGIKLANTMSFKFPSIVPTPLNELLPNIPFEPLVKKYLILIFRR